MNPRNTVLVAFVEHEWRTQIRSPRFLAVTSVYILLTAVPPWLLLRYTEYLVTVRDFAYDTWAVLPALTLLISAALAYDLLAREHAVNAFQVCSLTPVSSARYLLYRWLALLSMLIPLTLIGPVSGLAATIYADIPFSSGTIFFARWLIHLLPLTLMVSALSLAAGTIARSLVGAGILVLLLMNVAFSALAWILDKLGSQLPDSTGFLGIQNLLIFLNQAPYGPSRYDFGGADFNTRATFDYLLPQMVIPLGIAILFLSLATSYLSRTRPDLKPMTIRSDHPLRSFLRQWNTVRVRMRPDAVRSWQERIMIITSLLLLILAGAYSVARENRLWAMAETRYAAELETIPAPTSMDLVPRAAAIRGDIDRSGTVSTTGTITFENAGTKAVSRIALMLPEYMAIDRLELGDVPIRFERVWDRVWGELPHTIAPGKSAALRFTISGSPRSVHFAGWHRWPFAYYWQDYLEDEFRPPLANSYIEPLIADTLAVIPSNALMPLPRYTSWEPKDRLAVPEEAFLVSAKLDVDIDVPFVTVDSCGNVSDAGSLHGQCRMPLHMFTLTGGDLSVMQNGRTIIVAHRDFEHLARTHQVALEGFAEKAFADWDEALDPERQPWMITGQRDGLGLVTIEPAMIHWSTFFYGDWIVEQALTRRLLRNRHLTPGQGPFFQAFYGALAGLEARRRPQATLRYVPTGDPPPLESPASKARDQLGPIVASLEYRVGSEALRNGVKRFIRADGLGTAEELFDSIGAASDQSLRAFYEDFILGLKLPRIEIASAEVERSGRRWSVHAVIRNAGDGEAACPVVLLTESEPLERRVLIPAGGSAEVDFEVSTRPRSIQVDPDQKCYRLAGPGLEMTKNIEL